ncbi:MAG: Trk system potassium transporter TrkA [Ruminococcaceae bacterium]|nr:Trk system potassium transporter TrkA [Oscillospiraceae bacterium]
MRIVIIGDGKVGHTLTELLSAEGHDIVIVDRDEKVIENVVNTFDVLGIIGNGASYKVQMEAGVNKSDLLIAATSSDELNILSCMVAKKIGAKNTIARVRNPEYSEQLIFLKEELGLSLVINPEMETAMEISRVLRFPSALKIESFSRGRVDLVEIRIAANSPVAGKSLQEIAKAYSARILVCVVQRGEKIFIPNGAFILREGDHITMTGDPAGITAFFKQIGIYKEKSRSAMIIGGGKIGYYLAKRLTQSGMHVKIIEKDEERCIHLSEMLPRAEIVCGDGSEHELLIEEGLTSFDACVAMTDIDEENIIISMYAESLRVPKVVPKVNRMSLAKMLDDVGVEGAVSPKSVTTNRIVSYVRAMQNSFDNNSVETLCKIVDQKVEALEFRVTDKMKYAGVPLSNLKLKPNLLVACIVRKGKALIPGGSDCMQPGDSVIVVTADHILRTLDDIFADA